MKKINSFLWKVITSILFVILIASVLTSGFGLKQALVKIPADELADQTIKFINESLLQPGSVASLVEADCQQRTGLCKLTMSINDRNFDSYISADGQLLFPEAIEVEKMKQANEQAAQNQPATIEDIPKMDIPEVKLFAMALCPFGLQAEKALLPVSNLLKDHAEIKIHFVNYIMHEKQEIDENLRQYCIQKQEPEKFTEYLGCFVKDGDFEKCLSRANINKSRLSDCVAQTDKEYGIYAAYENKETWLNGRFPLFKIDDELNQQYGVQGSPTMIINDQVVAPARTPESYKEAICLGFKSMPEQCFETLSDKVPVSGFGEGEASSSSDAQCL